MAMPNLAASVFDYPSEIVESVTGWERQRLHLSRRWYFPLPEWLL